MRFCEPFFAGPRWDKHARPISIKGRPSKSKKKKKKEKKQTRGGSLPSANVYAHTKNLRQTLPTLSRWTGEGRRLLQVLFLYYHQTKTLNNADNFFLSKSLSKRLGTKPRERQICPCNTYNQSTVGLRFKTAIPTKWRSWCVGDSRHMVDCRLRVQFFEQVGSRFQTEMCWRESAGRRWPGGVVGTSFSCSGNWLRTRVLHHWQFRLVCRHEQAKLCGREQLKCLCAAWSWDVGHSCHRALLCGTLFLCLSPPVPPPPLSL